MQIALNEKNARIMAYDANKEGDYRCPLCGGAVILRQGSINIWHFAHKERECADKWHYDMSEWHFRMQAHFPEEQREVVITHNGQTHRADILKGDMVIEFQHSPISLEELEERNIFYNSAGYKVAWVFDLSEQFFRGVISDVIREDDTLMYKWSNPKRYLSCLPVPKEASKEIVVHFYWGDGDEEWINRVIWSTKNDEGNPDFKRFIVDNYSIEIEEYMDISDFFLTRQERLNSYIKSLGKKYVIRNSGIKGMPRETYVCPMTNVFGIRKFGEEGCLYCRYCAAIKEYSRGFASYCFYPNAVREAEDTHPRYDCDVAPRY